MTKQTAFRLNELDLDILNRTMKAHSFGTRTEALRYILRNSEQSPRRRRESERRQQRKSK